jgi:hypothetical protein
LHGVCHERASVDEALRFLELVAAVFVSAHALFETGRFDTEALELGGREAQHTQAFE